MKGVERIGLKTRGIGVSSRDCLGQSSDDDILDEK